MSSSMVLMEGPLTKEPRNAGGTLSLKSRKRYHFVLKKPSALGHGRLEYYEKKEEQTVPKGTILFEHIHSVEPIEASRKYSGLSAFKLVTKDRTYVFLCDTEEEQRRWVAAISTTAFPASAPPSERAVEENPDYSSGEEYAALVSIRDNEHSRRLGLVGRHSIVLNMECVNIFDPSSRHLKASLHFRFMRRIGRDPGYAFMEMGRRAQTGEGTFVFETPTYEVLYNKMADLLRRRKELGPSVSDALGGHDPLSPAATLQRASTMPGGSGLPPASPAPPPTRPSTAAQHDYDQADSVSPYAASPALATLPATFYAELPNVSPDHLQSHYGEIPPGHYPPPSAAAASAAPYYGDPKYQFVGEQGHAAPGGAPLGGAPRADGYNHLENAPAHPPVSPPYNRLAPRSPASIRAELPRPAAALPPPRAANLYDEADDTLKIANPSGPMPAASSSSSSKLYSATPRGVLPAEDEVAPKIDPTFYDRVSLPKGKVAMLPDGSDSD